MQKILSKNIYIKGLVQGVGFRPFIYRLAQNHGICGWVINTTDKVMIKAEGSQLDIDAFISGIKSQSPNASSIHTIHTEYTEPEGLQEFSIKASYDDSDEITQISPDIAVCSECLVDLKKQPHRNNYPLINCTNCGPRFSIIKSLPYDRNKTTMDVFEMCHMCQKEYHNITDRRFHAQPLACNNCGPKYKLEDGKNEINDIDEILHKTARLLQNGQTIAIKGTGGFFLMGDARNETAVKKLRIAKNRDGKPFAVMFSSLEQIKNYCEVSSEEATLLLSWQKPIVLLKQIQAVAPGVNMGFASLGCMLPNMPFHYLLFEYIDFPVVYTSGNLSETPILIDDDKARQHLLPVCDALVTYNREIYNRVDDSVLFVLADKHFFVRRSRGYVPNPVNLSFNTDGIIGTGAELVNCFAVGRGKDVILSQHMGDLKNMETYDFYTQTLQKFKHTFRVTPKIIVCDKHPNYLSTRFAQESGLPVAEVQHHHAHIASCMAENDIHQQVIGIVMDGTGYGDDGNIWGGEIMISDISSYQRCFHFHYVPIPGGDAAIKEPWRTGLAYLYKSFGDALYDLSIPFVQCLNKNNTGLLLEAMDKDINAPLSSSAGRLFDAIAAITGICTRASYHAEAPMRLEAAIESDIDTFYDYDIKNGLISFFPMIRAIVEDISSGLPVSLIAAKFHNTVCEAVINTAKYINNQYHIDKVVLTGGSFQNRYLLSHTVQKLADEGFDVYTHQKVPCNDAGIALGQVAVAGNMNLFKDNDC